ncbi:XdhC family protein [Peptococcaceae bacterium 1198_IL3148]
MANIYQSIMQLLNEGEKFALATILSNVGSSPRTAGSKMIVRQDGTIIGTIGGGLLEAKVQRQAAQVIADGNPVVQSFNLRGADVDQMDMICGGQIEVLIECMDGQNDHLKDTYSQLLVCQQNRQRAVLVTKYYDSTNDQIINQHLLLQPGNAEQQLLPSEAVETVFNVSKGRYPQVLTFNNDKYLVDPIYNANTLYIFGAGHVSQKLCAVASMVDFATVVLDDRAEFANRDRFATADQVLVIPSFEQPFNNLAIDKDSFIVIVTRGHAHDKTVLQQALSTRAGYIGMIGSKRKRDAIYSALMNEGITQDDLARVYSPIGLEIAAETPEEIAVSIVAELIKVRAALK